jgi:GNAT superfamily N-acetyltransferase
MKDSESQDQSLERHLRMYSVSPTSSKDAVAVLARLAAIEKKSFPASEVFNFNTRLLRKHNTTILAAYLTTGCRTIPVAYAVYVRWRSVILVQKLCVTESFRGRRIGKSIMLDIISRARQARCMAIELWVDESRTVARHLYKSCGFRDIHRVQEYYAPGRHGIKMGLDLIG